MGRRARAPARLLALTVLGFVVVTGAAVAGPALAAPTPIPAPTPAPGPGVPDPGARPAPNPTPPPIGPPPTAPPNPAPPGTPVPTPVPVPDGSDSDPGLFDIPGQIRKAISEFLLWVARTGLTPVFDTLGDTVLSTPDLTGNDQVKTIWTTTLVAANAIFVLFIIVGGFTVASRETLQNQYAFKDIARRLVIGALAANLSLIVCGKAIEATNALTAGILGQGVDGPAAANAIIGILDRPLSSKTPNIMLALLVIAVVILAVVVVITFILRVASLVLLIGVAPLALACHATPQTEELAYTWWRALGACLAWQLGQAVIVLATVKVFLTPTGPTVLGPPKTGDSLLGVLVCVTMLWLLVKLPGWMRQLILGPLGQRHGRGLFGQLIHAYLTIKTLGAIVGLTRAGKRTGRPSGPPTGGPGRPPSPPPGPPRPAPSPTRPPVPPSVRRPRRTPAPAGPAAFSHAPLTQAPLAVPTGTTGALTFSHAPPPGTPQPPPAGGVSPVRFSQAPALHAAPTASTSRPAAVRFSDTPVPPAAGRRPSSAPPLTVFSAAARPQTAPRRPPAPHTAVFSSAPGAPAVVPAEARPGRPTVAVRPTAARSATTPPPSAATPTDRDRASHTDSTVRTPPRGDARSPIRPTPATPPVRRPRQE